MWRVLIFAMLLCIFGCAENTPHFTQAQKDSLHAFFDPKSRVVVPKDRESDFFSVVEAFAESRHSDEFVRSVDFNAKSEATLLFSNSGMHGGGIVTLQKKGSRWTIAQKLYFL